MAKRKGRNEAVVRVSCIQMEPVVGDLEDNRRRSIDLVERAAEAGATLIVLPELCSSGYVFETREEATALAEEVPAGPYCGALAHVAAKRDVYVVAGVSERRDQALFNSAVLVGPEGYIGSYRKVHLWNEENLFYEPGDLGFPVFRTAFGRLGMLICYDCWFPEAWRLCALQGADIVCVPTNWVPIPGQDESREAMANVLCMAAAHANSMFVAAADRVGNERGQPFIGQSLIVSYAGWPIGGPASHDGEEIVTADVNLADARRKRNWNEYNQVLRDRRTDIYHEMLGSELRAGWY